MNVVNLISYIKCRFTNAHTKKGQAMTEYIIMTGLLLASVVIISIFLFTFRAYSGRTLDLVSSEYP